jgi:circadian clock protein KaiC
MTDTIQYPTPERLPIGVQGLDRITCGGLFKGGIYIVAGLPGVGKTILGNQVAFAHVKRGGRALYVTLLSETHARILSQMRALSFFDEDAVGDAIHYVNGFAAVEKEGLEGLLNMLRSSVRERGAQVLVLDGLLTAGSFARSGIDYKKFINELQTWVGVIGCTVVCLASGSPETAMQPEFTMVDGILELATKRVGMRAVRELTISKFRGTAYVEGSHAYHISSDGVCVWPRLEAVFDDGARILPEGRVHFGIPQLDEMLAGGLARGSTTLLLGPSGSGKTILGLHFLAAGAAAGEPVLHFGSFENPPALLAKADRLGFRFTEHLREGRLLVRWHPAVERTLDALGDALLSAVKEKGIQRVLMDGMRGFAAVAQPQRLGQYLCALREELLALGCTTMITEETREIYPSAIEETTTGASAVCDNIILLRQLEAEGTLLRLLTVIKTRDTNHDRGLWEFDIAAEGLKLLGRLQPQAAVLPGAPPKAGRVTGQRLPRKKSGSAKRGKSPR